MVGAVADRFGPFVFGEVASGNGAGPVDPTLESCVHGADGAIAAGDEQRVTVGLELDGGPCVRASRYQGGELLAGRAVRQRDLAVTSGAGEGGAVRRVRHPLDPPAVRVDWRLNPLAGGEVDHANFSGGRADRETGAVR